MPTIHRYQKIRLMGSGRPGWQHADAKTNYGFSALLFAFGVRLHQDLDVPVGLIVGAVGGTPSGYWLTPEMLAADAPCQAMIKRFAATYDFEAEKKNYERKLTAWEQATAQAKKEDKKPPVKPAPPVKPGESTGRIGNLYDAHRHFAPIRGISDRVERDESFVVR
jgi:sialate O-acetylesterase